MNYDEIRAKYKPYLRNYVESNTQKSKGKNMYVCPLCGSGTGKNKTGAFNVKAESWHCHSCGEGGDIFDLVGKLENITEHSEQIKRVIDLYGDAAEYQNQAKNAQYTHNSIHTYTYTQKQEEKKVSYKDFFLEANKNLDNTSYHRGISKETLEKFNIGYIEQWRHPKAPDTVPYSPRLIIPTSEYSYLARDTREDMPEYQKQYSKSKVGEINLFNLGCLKTAKEPIYLVEGEIDALSIIDAGRDAVALGSVTMARSFIKAVEDTRPKKPIIIALDQDQAGAKATTYLKEALTNLGIINAVYSPAGEYKDANEALQKNKEEFIKAVNYDFYEIQEIRDKVEEYQKKSNRSYMQDFIQGIRDNADTPITSTGFSKLDKALEGGLFEGFYILGAVPSLGKTTLAMQIADQIAEQGQDILIISLEMARSQLIAKSISRHTFLEQANNEQNFRLAKTSRGITVAKKWEKYSNEEKQAIYNAMNVYNDYANHIYIVEGVGDLGVAEIRAEVEEYITVTGKKPIVIIDYFQILAPADPRATDKQNIDKAVIELRRLARDYKLTIIAISSFNRNSYKDKVSMASFKESGGIEYTADVLIGLQLKGVGGSNFDEQEAKSKNPREIELVILKNREAATGEAIEYKYFQAFNYFEEV